MMTRWGTRTTGRVVAVRELDSDSGTIYEAEVAYSSGHTGDEHVFEDYAVFKPSVGQKVRISVHPDFPREGVILGKDIEVH